MDCVSLYFAGMAVPQEVRGGKVKKYYSKFDVALEIELPREAAA